jgi:hypothetical protein
MVVEQTMIFFAEHLLIKYIFKMEDLPWNILPATVNSLT